LGNYQSTPPNIPEGRMYHIRRGGTLKSRVVLSGLGTKPVADSCEGGMNFPVLSMWGILILPGQLSDS